MPRFVAALLVTASASLFTGDLIVAAQSRSRNNVSGRIVDEHGSAIAGARVLLLAKLTPTLLVVHGETRTDDRGSYRLTVVPDAEYVVMVPSTQTTVPGSLADALPGRGAGDTRLRTELANAGIRSDAVGRGASDAVSLGTFLQWRGSAAKLPQSTGHGRFVVYPTLFSGNTLDPSRARTVVLEPAARGDLGGEVKVDFTLRPVPAASVSGLLTGPDGPLPHIALRLTAAQPGPLPADLDVASTVSDAQGRFTFATVPAGEYVLKVLTLPGPTDLTAPTAAADPDQLLTVTFVAPTRPPPQYVGPTLWANVRLSVGASDVSNLTVTARRGTPIIGRLVFDGASPPPSPDQLARTSLAIRSSDGRSILGGVAARRPFPPVRVAADGTFKTAELPDGEYTIVGGALPDLWTLKTASADGRDVTDTPISVISPSRIQLTLTYTDQAATISGYVLYLDGYQAPGSLVIVIPADRRQWLIGRQPSHRFRTATAAQGGEYRVSGLLSGEYSIVAVPSRDTRMYLANAEVLENLVRLGRKIRLRDGEQRSIPLVTEILR